MKNNKNNIYDMMKKSIYTRKRKASMMDIFATAAWKSLWMAWCMIFEMMVLMGFVIIDHMVLLDTGLNLMKCVCV